MQILRGKGAEVVVYEPTLKDDEFCGYRVVCDLHEFASECNIIAANRITDELVDYKNKVYTRDVFFRD